MTVKTLEKTILSLPLKDQKKIFDGLSSFFYFSDADLSRLETASKSKSFKFLKNKKENIYSLKDGKAI